MNDTEMEMKTMYGIATLVLMMAALMAAQRKCSNCGRTGHNSATCAEGVNHPAQTNDEGPHWADDVANWVSERKEALPKADGVTIYPEKMSLQPGKKDRIQGLTRVLIGRADTFRRNGFHLPESEIWAVLPDAMVAIVLSDSRGHTFTEAKGLVQGLLTWAQECESLAVQTTLSDETGFMVLDKPYVKESPIDLWYGRPKRTGHRYVVSGAREDVE